MHCFLSYVFCNRWIPACRYSHQRYVTGFVCMKGHRSLCFTEILFGSLNWAGVKFHASVLDSRFVRMYQLAVKIQ